MQLAIAFIATIFVTIIMVKLKNIRDWNILLALHASPLITKFISLSSQTFPIPLSFTITILKFKLQNTHHFICFPWLALRLKKCGSLSPSFLLYLCLLTLPFLNSSSKRSISYFSLNSVTSFYQIYLFLKRFRNSSTSPLPLPFHPQPPKMDDSDTWPIDSLEHTTFRSSKPTYLSCTDALSFYTWKVLWIYDNQV